MKAPIVVIGSGIAGLNFALRAALAVDCPEVVILTKKITSTSSTNYAQGGIAAVLDQLDSFEKHVSDTMAAGAFHNNKKAVEFMVKRAPEAIYQLIKRGIDLETFEGRLALTREGGHSASRIVFKGDYTGKEVESGLIRNVREHPKIKIIEHAMAVDIVNLKLELNKGGCGVAYLHSGKLKFIEAASVVIATGGIGQLFDCTTNPSISTGDGIAMAYRAGAEITDMEFVQFHPTAFIPSRGRPFLISEAVRGEGAYLKNSKGDRFVDELTSRDVVALSIFEELKKGPVYLDIRHKPSSDVRLRFPTIYENLIKHGFDLTKDLIPIKPAAHYLCGGIKVDLHGRTSVPGLYAVGEAACTGVHGANRLASNSLLEALVFSDNLEVKWVGEYSSTSFRCDLKLNAEVDTAKRIKELRKLMWDNCGIVRNPDGLKFASMSLKKMKFKLYENPARIPVKKMRDFIVYRNMLDVATLVVEAALKRKKSLGCHVVNPPRSFF